MKVRTFSWNLRWHWELRCKGNGTSLNFWSSLNHWGSGGLNFPFPPLNLSLFHQLTYDKRQCARGLGWITPAWLLLNLTWNIPWWPNLCQCLCESSPQAEPSAPGSASVMDDLYLICACNGEEALYQEPGYLSKEFLFSSWARKKEESKTKHGETLWSREQQAKDGKTCFSDCMVIP